jgi:hypothetical protein
MAVQLGHRRVHRLEGDQLAGRQALGQQVLHRRRQVGAGRQAPAPFEELRQPLLHPHRRAIVRQRRHHVVHHLVREAVEPRIAEAQGARAGGHQARPLAKRDGAGALDLGGGQCRHRGQIRRRAVDVDVDGTVGLEAEIARQRRHLRFQALEREVGDDRVLGREAQDEVLGPPLVVPLDGLAGRLGQVHHLFDGAGAWGRRRGRLQLGHRGGIVAAQEPLVALQVQHLGRRRRALRQGIQRRGRLGEAPAVEEILDVLRLEGQLRVLGQRGARGARDSHQQQGEGDPLHFTSSS